jgi:hypothetical protein
MSDQQCPCGAPLKPGADETHGVCRGCRVDAKKRQRRQPVQQADTMPMFDVGPQPRRLVEVAGWPDYRADLSI